MSWADFMKGWEIGCEQIVAEAKGKKLAFEKSTADLRRQRLEEGDALIERARKAEKAAHDAEMKAMLAEQKKFRAEMDTKKAELEKIRAELVQLRDQVFGAAQNEDDDDGPEDIPG